MQARCRGADAKAAKNYSGRGITVCAQWSDFGTFLADMGQRPEGTSLDRIDNDGNYEPTNCRWATAGQQARNRRSSTLGDITWNGETRSLSEWAAPLGMNPQTLRNRICRDKWPLEYALTTPSRQLERRHRATALHFIWIDTLRLALGVA